MEDETASLQGYSNLNMLNAADIFRNTAGLVSTIHGVIPQTQSSTTGAFIFKEPYGVIYGIAPWNAPYILGARAFVYAIAAGNTVVLRGSELSPRTAWALGSVMHEAGLPEGVLNVIYHCPEDAIAVSTTIIEHPAVRKINFTGSTAVGMSVAVLAGRSLKPLLMELGGKASSIVCEDADIEKAASHCALGAFMHAGQVCMATERILVHSSIVEKFAEAMRIATCQVYAQESEAPILVSKLGVKKNRELCEDAVKKGATMLHGDISSKEASDFCFRPVILTGFTKDMDIYYTESFGPTASLITVNSDEEAIEVENDTEYGLSGAVFTGSLTRGLRIATEIDSGAVHINGMSIHDEPMLPHGGVKKSGRGRFNGTWGMEEFLRAKTVTYQQDGQ